MVGSWSSGGNDISRRLAAVPAGGTLTLEAGSYRVNSSISVDRPLRIVGAGRDKTTIVTSGSGAGITFGGPGRLELADVAIIYQGNRAADVVKALGGEIHLRNVRVSGGRDEGSVFGAGLLIERSARAFVLDSIFETNGVGVVVTGDGYIELSNSVIRGNYQRGISFLGKSRGVVQRNLVEANGFNRDRRDYWQGIGVQDNAAPVLDGNTIRGNAGIGIQYRNSSSGVAKNNTVEDNGHNGARYAPATASGGGSSNPAAPSQPVTTAVEAGTTAVTAAPERRNLALASLGATTSDNGHFDDGIHTPGPSRYAIDDDPTTYWSGLARASPQVMWVNIPRTYTIDRVVIRELDVAFLNRGLLEFFDGTSWHRIATIEKASPGYAITFAAVTASAVRLSVHASTSPSSWYNRVACIVAFEVYAI